MKKILNLVFVLVLIMLIPIISACGNDKYEGNDDAEIKLEAFTIAGETIDKFVISADKTNDCIFSAADNLKDIISKKTGANLTIASDTDGKKAIVFERTEKNIKNGLSVSVENGNMYIRYSDTDLLVLTCMKFVQDEIQLKTGELIFKEGYKYMSDVKTVKYSDYGAVGDGVTDDYAAIKKAHDDANKHGYFVSADSGATYLIGAKGLPTVEIKTDTSWTGASFIIDDRAIKKITHKSASIPVFTVPPSLERLDISPEDVPSLKKGATNLGFAPGKDCLVFIKNNNVKRYIRYGANANSGAHQQEILLVKANGDIDPTTPVVWNYQKITDIWAAPIDEKPITITGGDFLTLANEINPEKYEQVNRSITVKRSNVTLSNIKHKVEQVQDYRAAYAGIFNIVECNNVRVYKCEIFCHRGSYFTKTNEDGSTQKVLLGSYELTANHASNVVYEQVIQTNLFEEDGTLHNQGLMGTNYCKNMFFINSTIARFDAHMELHNLTVKGSTIQRVNTIGSGTVRIEDTKVYGDFMVDLRSDYGGHFNGDYYIKNVTFMNPNNTRLSLFSGSWANHYFGYTVVQPQHVYIDNLSVAEGKNNVVYLYTAGLDNKPDLTAETVNGVENKNIIVPTKEVNVISNPGGTVFRINNGPTFANTQLILPEGGSDSGNNSDNSNGYYVNAPLNDSFPVNKDGFITSNAAYSNGRGSIQLQISGNGHSNLNLKPVESDGNKAILFTGSGNPNNVTKHTNICVDIKPSPDTSNTDPFAYAELKGKSFVVSFDIKPLQKTTTAHDGLTSALFTFTNAYATSTYFLDTSVQMRLSDYSLFIPSNGARSSIELGVSLEVGKYSTIAMHVNVKENTFDLYLNGKKIASDVTFIDDSKIDKICTYDKNQNLVPSTKANKMEDLLISYARLAMVCGWSISAPIYEFDNPQLYFSDEYIAK